MPSEDRVRVGRIPYANLFPIFSMLDEATGSPRYEFVYGVPSFVNRLLREGEVDVSPSSSIEYLRREDAYVLVEGHSISSFGPIGSILLFSKRPIETLDGLTVLTTSQSETSVALLAITLKKFYDCDCSLRLTDAALPEAIQSSPASLLIGDDALREALKWPRLHIYDLGDIWYRNTGLPFVFALWIARKEWCENNPVLLKRFKSHLDAAKERAMKDLQALAKKSPLVTALPEEEIVSYWQNISYDFAEEHKKGLALFKEYAKEMALI